MFKGDVAGYEWHKFNIFSCWLAPSHRTILLMFDMSQLAGRLPSLLQDAAETNSLCDPFWIYPALMDEVVSLQDEAVWAIRTQIRQVEIEQKKSVLRPAPDYRRLHDIARHAIHVSETLGIAVKTLSSIIDQHRAFRASTHLGRTSTQLSMHIQQLLLFFEHMLDSLRFRSSSNKQRLQNEIQLAFHKVAQYDSSLSVEIGRNAQQDSAAMKTISFLTLTILPATFISSVFSMSFFNFNPDSNRWIVSDKIWIYWVLAIPITILSSFFWHHWHRGVVHTSQSPQNWRS